MQIKHSTSNLIKRFWRFFFIFIVMAQMSNFEKAKALIKASDPERFLAFQLVNNELHILYMHNGNEEVFMLNEEEVNKIAESFE